MNTAKKIEVEDERTCNANILRAIEQMKRSVLAGKITGLIMIGSLTDGTADMVAAGINKVECVGLLELTKIHVASGDVVVEDAA